MKSVNGLSNVNFMNKVLIFRHLWPCTASVKVKVTLEAPLDKLSYELNMKALWQLEPELWQKCDFHVIYDVIVTSSDVVRAKTLYLWNQWTETFHLIYYSTMLENVRFFSKLWPWPNFSRSRAKVTVKVTYDGPRDVLFYGLNLQSLCQLEPKLWPIMCFSRFPWPWPWPLTLTFKKRRVSSVCDLELTGIV